MPNSLTGDFEAVLQISGGTLRRLVANMHQHAFAAAANPSIPHVAYFRLDDSTAPGQSGSVAAQIGVPYLHLIHGATDRFRIEFGIRARYRADPGTTPLADLIHGTVTAEYRRQHIDPSCTGWRGLADESFWFRVVADSVRFEGTVLNESSALVLTHLLDEPQVRDFVRRHLAAVLTRQFEPEPQRVSPRFRRMRSLAFGPGPGDSAIVLPCGLGTDVPPGRIESVDRIFLNGHDLALGVSAEALVARVRPFVDPIVGRQVNVHHETDAGIGGGLSIDYHARVDAAGVDWLGAATLPFFPSGGVLRLRLAGVGWASRLYRSGVFNLPSVSASDLRTTFTIDQYLLLTFNPATEFLSVAPMGTPLVDVRGGPKAGYVVAAARDAILKDASAQVAGPLGAARAALDAMGAQASRAPLVEALRGLDARADAHFTGALFDADGVVLCGPVTLGPRHRPQVSFARLPSGDGFDAIESWIPGGRIDRFSWTWRWFTSPIEPPPGPPGTSTAEHTFLLRRPAEPRTRFGLAVPRDEPLPGLDGSGKLCLSVSGVQVDPFSGVLVPVASTVECTQFGFEFKLPYEVGPYLRVCDPLRAVEGPAPEVGLLRVAVSEPQHASNALVVHLGGRLDEEVVETLTRGLSASRADGAGLVVVLVFRDGSLERDADAVRSHLATLRRALPAPLLVAEDVREGWSTALTLSAEGPRPSWRLITPAGVVRWSHDGRIDADVVTRMIDTRLVASGPPALAPIRAELELGRRLPIDLAGRDCPPMPLGRGGLAGAKVTFVARGSASGLAALERVRDRPVGADDDADHVAVVVDGADAQEVEALKTELRLDIPLFPDPRGALTRRAGVRFSPATITLDRRGIVTAIDAADGSETDDAGPEAEAD
jgi:hypothetical protein